MSSSATPRTITTVPEINFSNFSDIEIFISSNLTMDMYVMVSMPANVKTANIDESTIINFQPIGVETKNIGNTASQGDKVSINIKPYTATLSVSLSFMRCS